MVCTFLLAYPLENFSKIDLDHYCIVCHHYREVQNSDLGKFDPHASSLMFQIQNAWHCTATF